ncbi:DUF3800 domain-containing protein [Rhizobium leguminosarum]|uniref:DUF3800 domain-containing protein n=1 Tax=Rhizobium leguminosarum TaxID=384 RepID=A0A7W9ZSG6_RHILE|nr:DUF3800 domain-containing protein [Rhizobium leguminosarum]MBB6220689.1 hypothetical protein [Rhizobium leguminosarum]
MFVTYFDEVKAMPQNGQNHYIVAGLVVPADMIGQLETAVTDLSEKYFNTRELITGSEFHASHCYFGKSHFKGKPVAERVEMLAELLKIISNAERVKRVYAAIDTDKLWGGNAPEVAFQHFVERAEMAIPSDAAALLIGDLDDQQAHNMVREFQRYRQHGTPTRWGINIKSLVDSVHFCRSHHSRLLQLADVYAFHVAGNFSTRTGYIAEKFAETKKDINLFPHRYKEWPK